MSSELWWSHVFSRLPPELVGDNPMAVLNEHEAIRLLSRSTFGKSTKPLLIGQNRACLRVYQRVVADLLSQSCGWSMPSEDTIRSWHLFVVAREPIEEHSKLRAELVKMADRVRDVVAQFVLREWPGGTLVYEFAIDCIMYIPDDAPTMLAAAAPENFADFQYTA